MKIGQNRTVPRHSSKRVHCLFHAGFKRACINSVSVRLRMDAALPRPSINQSLSVAAALISICCQRLNKAAALSEYVSVGGGDVLTGGRGIGSGSQGGGAGVAQPLKLASSTTPITISSSQTTLRICLRLTDLVRNSFKIRPTCPLDCDALVCPVKLIVCPAKLLIFKLHFYRAHAG